MKAKNKKIIDLDVDFIGDPNRRMTDDDRREISKFLKLNDEGREQYIRNNTNKA